MYTTAGSRISFVPNCLGEALNGAKMTAEELARCLKKEEHWVKSVLEGRYCPDDQAMGDILIALKIYPTSENLARVFPHTREEEKKLEAYTEGE